MTSLLTGNLVGDATRNKNPNNREIPKMSHYRTKDTDVFAIRGTADNEDLVMDSILVIQDSLREIIQHPTILEKEKQFAKYIRGKHRRDNLVIVGHSLASYHANRLHKIFPEARVVGFGHAGFDISPKAEAVYSYDKDPLYRPTGKSNHIVLNKPPSAFLHNPFKEFHSTNNFYAGTPR